VLVEAKARARLLRTSELVRHERRLRRRYDHLDPTAKTYWLAAREVLGERGVQVPEAGRR
jgi:hypothetical protein